MMRKTAILIDDEKNCLDILEFEIAQLDFKIDVVSKCQDPRRAKSLIEDLNPDLIFLDIEMPWMTGFQLLDSLEGIHFDLIFATAYDQYAIKAFEYYALDYILKPVDAQALNRLVEKLFKKEKQSNNEQISEILKIIKPEKQQQKRIAFPTQSGFEFYDFKDIIRCEADSNYAHVFVDKRKKLMVSKPLKSICLMLEDPRFFRIHQSHLINLDHLIKYDKSDGGQIFMSDGSVVPLSRQKKSEFLDRVKRM